MLSECRPGILKLVKYIKSDGGARAVLQGGLHRISHCLAVSGGAYNADNPMDRVEKSGGLRPLRRGEEVGK